MVAIQLEFDDVRFSHIEDKSDVGISHMQNQIDALNDSMGKVRRKLFCEISEMKKQIALLKIENEHLKSVLKGTCNEKTTWSYGQNGCLFDVSTNT